MKQRLLLVALAALVVPFTGRAVTVVDVTTGVTLFHDNFESGSFSPDAGTWTIVGPDVSVTNAASPGASQGSFYAQLFRNSNTNSQGNLQAQVSLTPATGDLIRLQIMVYLPSSTDTDARAQFILDNGDFNSGRAWARPDGMGNVLAVGPGFSITDTGLNYLNDTWQLWQLEYVIGSSTFTVSVGGISAGPFTSTTSGTVNFADLLNGAKTPAGSFFLDAVPEPSTWVLVTLGVLTLAWRYRSRVRAVLSAGS